VEESIKAFTINNAIAAFEGDIRGSIEAGKLADLTVFDRNMIKIAEADILKTEVAYTIVDGKVVFAKS
jgi:predicted amidohydrolase YtcJ